MFVVVLIAVMLMVVGPKDMVGIGRRADLPFLLAGVGAATVAFSRAMLGRIGSTFNDVTNESGSLLGWLLLSGGTGLLVMWSAIA
jgi:hypothetical protein